MTSLESNFPVVTATLLNCIVMHNSGFTQRRKEYLFCHAMIHRRIEPYTIEEIKERIKTSILKTD